MKEIIEQRLRILIGKRLSRRTRTLNMEMLEFGTLQKIDGGEIGEQAKLIALGEDYFARAGFLRQDLPGGRACFGDRGEPMRRIAWLLNGGADLTLRRTGEVTAGG